MKTLIFVVAEDWYFLSHRLPMARAAKAAGYDVAVACRISGCRAAIEAEGIRVLLLPIERRSLNPLAAFRTIATLICVYRRERPEIVHHIAMKPVLFGAIAAWAARVPVVINAFAGLGFVFVEKTRLAKIARFFLLRFFRILLRRKNAILLLQNDDDLNRLLAMHVAVAERVCVIRGSGVDTDRYAPSPMPALPFICVFAGRMIGIKGLAELKTAFALLSKRRPDITLWLCGEPDPANPGSWTMEQLRDWASDASNVVYKGRCSMQDIWPQAHLAVQPSLGGEGVPKSLLEAASCGRAILATDVPGCRDMVRDGWNGVLVPPGDAGALADALNRLCADPAALAEMGERSRMLLRDKKLSADDVEREAERLYRDAPMWIRSGVRPAGD